MQGTDQRAGWVQRIGLLSGSPASWGGVSAQNVTTERESLRVGAAGNALLCLINLQKYWSEGYIITCLFLGASID